ncbi:MAG: hypothetical protein ABI682_08860 [Acidobacteriota bacterium]
MIAKRLNAVAGKYNRVFGKPSDIAVTSASTNERTPSPFLSVLVSMPDHMEKIRLRSLSLFMPLEVIGRLRP